MVASGTSGSGFGGPALPPRLVLLVAVFSVGVSAILIRWVEDAPAVSIAFYRLFFTVLLLTPVAFGRHRSELAKLSARDLVTALGIGVVLAVHFASWIESLFHTSVASSVIIVSTEAILAAIAAAVFFGERLPWRDWLGIAVAFLGVTLIALADASGVSAAFPRAVYGDLLAFVGAIAAAVYLVGGRRVRQRVHIVTYVLVVYWACSLTLLVFALVGGAPLDGFAPRTWLLFVAMAVFPTIGGHTLINWCLRYMPAASVSTAILGEPLIAALLAAFLFAEVPGPLALVGGALTLVGILSVVRRPTGLDGPAVDTVDGPA